MQPIAMLWLILLLMIRGSVAGVGEEIFFPPRVLGVGEESFGIATSDLDGDGWLDLVVASSVSDYVFVLYGRGAGYFETVRLLTNGIGRAGVVITDLNDDEIADIALGSSAGISVYLGMGDRVFAEEVFYPTFVGPTRDAIIAADFDLDGHVDIVLGGDLNVVFLGNGDGTLSFLLPFNSSQGASNFLAIGDFNEDGNPDFLSDGATAWLGNGDGTFVKGPTGHGGFDGVVYDFDEDGHLDVALAGGGIRILLGDGQGRFSASAFYGGFSANSVTLADLNNDGRQDLAANDWFSSAQSQVSILLSNGDGTFAPAVGYSAPLLGGRLTSGDFDRDGRIDVASTSLFSSAGSDPASKVLGFQEPGLAFILSGDGQGGLVPGRVEYFGDTLDSPGSVVVGDFDHDGLQDLAAANRGSNEVSVLLGDGVGSFVDQTPVPVAASPVSLVTGQFDSGTDQDLAVASRDSSEVSILLGNGDGTFAFATSVALGRAPVFLVQADLDADGKQDLITANRDSGDLSILMGRGDGTFDPPVVIGVGGGPSSIAVADFDGQAGLDLAVVTGEVSILLGNGDGTFGAAVGYTTGITLSTIAAADLDNDGHTDLVVGGMGDTSAVALYGNGQGSVSAPVPLDLTARVQELSIADVDGDGRQDLVFAHTVPMVTVLLGVEGGFGPRLEFAAGGIARVAVGEFNRDGRLDLAVTHFNALGVLLNQAPVLVKFKTDTTTLTWPELVGYDSFNVYRGNLSGLQDDDEDGLPDQGHGICRNHLDPDLTDNVFVDDEDPLPGDGFFYLMSRVRDGVESDLGETSAGLPRMPSIPCTVVLGPQTGLSRTDDSSRPRRERRKK